MARVQTTEFFIQLAEWPGLLFQADDASVVTHDANLFVWEHGVGTAFAGYDIRISGSGFTYGAGDMPTGGRISAVQVLTDDGQVVLTIDQFSGNGIARDLAQMAANMFGWVGDADGRSPDGLIAWSQVLGGNDTIIGTSGHDRVLQGYMGGHDLFRMGAGHDDIWTGAGNDTVYGGHGFDVLIYSQAAFNDSSAYRGVNVNLGRNTVLDSWGDTDKVFSIEGASGTRFNDRFVGSDRGNVFWGLRGRDTIDGGAGNDSVYYEDDFRFGGVQGVVVDLETSVSRGVTRGYAIDGFGQRDTLISVENIRGTEFADQITGSRFANVLRPGDGDDTMTGGGGQDAFFFRKQGDLGDDDVITDFAATGAGRDKLQFLTEDFNGMTTTLTLVNGPGATDPVGTFVFNTTDSTLYWDEDGTGAKAALKVVLLTGVTSLSAENFDLF